MIHVVCLVILVFTRRSVLGLADTDQLQAKDTLFVKAAALAPNDFVIDNTVKVFSSHRRLECFMVCSSMANCKAVRWEAETKGCKILRQVPDGIRVVKEEMDGNVEGEIYWVKGVAGKTISQPCQLDGIVTGTTNCRLCPLEWEDFDGNCYKQPEQNTKGKYSEANQTCAQMKPKAHLPRIETEKEAEMLQKSIKGKVWIGLKRKDGGSEYKWHDGTSISSGWIRWKGGNPKNDSDQKTCSVIHQNQPKYESKECDEDHHVMCETEPWRSVYIRPATEFTALHAQKLLSGDAEACSEFRGSEKASFIVESNLELSPASVSLSIIFSNNDDHGEMAIVNENGGELPCSGGDIEPKSNTTDKQTFECRGTAKQMLVVAGTKKAKGSGQFSYKICDVDVE